MNLRLHRHVAPPSDYHVRERNARLRADWIYRLLSGAECADPREPVDAIVADDRLRFRRDVARAWLAERAKAKVAVATAGPQRLCRILSFHSTKHR